MLEPQFDLLDHFQSPYPVAIVKRDGKYGLIHRSGKILLPPEYTSVPYVGADKPNKIEKDRLWGFIDTGGQIIAPPQFESIGSFWGHVGWVKHQGLWGLYDLAGFFRVEPRFRQVGSAWSEGTAAVSEQGEWDDWGIIDTGGRYILPPRFVAARPFSEGLAIVRTGNKYGYVDTCGNYHIEPRFLYANDFKDERAWVKLEDGRSGLIDRDGRELLIDQFDYTEPFRNGIARVGRMPPGGSHYVYGLVHRDGRLLVAPQFDYIPDFYNGLVWVEVENGWNLLDTTGYFRFDTPFDERNEGYSKGTAVGKGNRYAWVDSRGRLLLPALFDRIRFVEYATFIIKDQKWGMIDNKGRVLLQPQFDPIELNHSLLPFEYSLSMSRGRFSLNCRGEMVVTMKNTDCIH